MTLHYLRGAAGGIVLLAGLAKLLGRSSSGAFLESLGVPPRAARAVGALAPAFEIALAVLLVASIGDRVVADVGAAFALVLAALQWHALRLGVTEDCRCFGALDAGDRRLDGARAVVLLAVMVATATLAHLQQGEGALDANQAMLAALGVLAGIGFVVASGVVLAVWRFHTARPLFSGSGSVILRS